MTLSEFKQIKFLLTSLTDMHAGLIAIFIFFPLVLRASDRMHDAALPIDLLPIKS